MRQRTSYYCRAVSFFWVVLVMSALCCSCWARGGGGGGGGSASSSHSSSGIRHDRWPSNGRSSSTSPTENLVFGIFGVMVVVAIGYSLVAKSHVVNVVLVLKEGESYSRRLEALTRASNFDTAAGRVQALFTLLGIIQTRDVQSGFTATHTATGLFKLDARTQYLWKRQMKAAEIDSSVLNVNSGGRSSRRNATSQTLPSPRTATVATATAVRTAPLRPTTTWAQAPVAAYDPLDDYNHTPACAANPSFAHAVPIAPAPDPVCVVGLVLGTSKGKSLISNGRVAPIQLSLDALRESAPSAFYFYYTPAPGESLGHAEAEALVDQLHRISPSP